MIVALVGPKALPVIRGPLKYVASPVANPAKI